MIRSWRWRKCRRSCRTYYKYVRLSISSHHAQISRQWKAKAEAQAQLETQLGTLRRKLAAKEQLEEAIEGKHSKLTEVQATSMSM